MQKNKKEKEMKNKKWNKKTHWYTKNSGQWLLLQNSPEFLTRNIPNHMFS